MGCLQTSYGDYKYFLHPLCIVAHLSIVFSGLGALASPLIAIPFAQLPRWSFNFLVSLGVAMIDFIFLLSVFKLNRQDGMYI